jgi:hypothetical protein
MMVKHNSKPRYLPRWFEAGIVDIFAVDIAGHSVLQLED